MSKIKIEADGPSAKVFVDGCELKAITNADLRLSAGNFPVLSISMCLTESDIEITDCDLVIDGINATEAIDARLLQYLLSKYQTIKDATEEWGKRIGL